MRGGAGWALIPGPPDVTWGTAALGGGDRRRPRRDPGAPPARGFARRELRKRRNVSALLIGNRVLLSERLVYSGLGIRTQGGSNWSDGFGDYGNIWPCRRALYLHFLIKLPSVCVSALALVRFSGSGRERVNTVPAWARDARHLELPLARWYWEPCLGSLAQRALGGEKKRETVKEKKWERSERLAGGVTQTVVSWLQGGVAKVTEDSHRRRLPPGSQREPPRAWLRPSHTEGSEEIRCLRNKFSSPYLACINQPVNQSIIYLYTCAVSSTNRRPVGYHPPPLDSYYI